MALLCSRCASSNLLCIMHGAHQSWLRQSLRACWVGMSWKCLLVGGGKQNMPRTCPMELRPASFENLIHYECSHNAAYEQDFGQECLRMMRKVLPSELLCEAWCLPCCQRVPFLADANQSRSSAWLLYPTGTPCTSP